MSTLALKHAFKNPDKLPYDKLKDNPALDNQFITVVYVKSTDVLVNDKFWRELEKHEADFCIIDDLDYMLTKRDSEVTNAEDQKKNDFLNQFLSFTDGVEKHKTKFIITTNQKYDDIDSALLRKGRLFDILELRQLDHKEALNIWLDNELSETDFNELFTAHEVLPAELGSEIAKRLNTRISTATDSYLKEDGISKVLKAGRAKKIGI
jgi:SpoVK/Ycf46/Vps4 family AAA+-type ATPase